MRVLSVANLLHKPAGISATSGVAGGLKRGLVDTAPFPRVWGEAPRLYAAGTAAIMALSQNSPTNLVLAARKIAAHHLRWALAQAIL